MRAPVEGAATFAMVACTPLCRGQRGRCASMYNDFGTEVTIVEDVVSGPGLLVPGIARQPGLKWRNSETLRRLRLLVEGRAGRTQTR